MLNVQGALEKKFGLSGRVAIVTGAGAGLGRQIALTLAESGAFVVSADLDLPAAQRTASMIIDQGAAATAKFVDVADETSIKALFSAVRTEKRQLDVLVNNAGIFPMSPLLETSGEKWDRVQAVNLRGTFPCMREAILQMREKGAGGAIVNISAATSVAALLFDNADYSASKAGVNNLTKGAALEFAPDRIRINAVLPGAIPTDGAAKFQGTQRSSILHPSRSPLGLGTPQDIANAVHFLVSPAASHITGHLLVVDGGFLVS